MRDAVDVILRDGSTMRLRAPVRDDAAAIVEFFAGLSVHSRFLRFHGLAAAGERFARTLVEPDWEEKGSFVGVMGEADEERIVAVGNYVRLRDRHTAEAAFAVADDYQRNGIGTRLLEQLAARASEHGIDAFVAEVLPENATMLGVFENIGFRATRALEGGVVRGALPARVRPRATGSASTSATTSRVTASLRPFFQPSTVAVVGASARRGTIGGELFRNVLAGGFTGAAYPVNRRRRARRPASGPTAPSRRSPTTSTCASSACPASTCSPPPRKRCARGRRRSA